MKTIFIAAAFFLATMSLAQAQQPKQGPEPKQQDESDYYDTPAKNKGTKQDQSIDPKKAEPDYGSGYYSDDGSAPEKKN